MKLLQKQTLVTVLSCAIFCLPSLLFAHEGDTLKCHFENGTPHLYLYPNGGFICGTNGFGDLEIAQKYGVDTVITSCTAENNSTLPEVYVWFGAKKVGLGDSVRVKVYGVNHNTGAPSQLLSTSFPVTMSSIDTSSADSVIYTRFLMQTPAMLNDSFFVSVEFSTAFGDTIGVMSTTDGDAGGSKLAWTKDSTGLWASILSMRSLDVDLAIFPKVVDQHDEGFPELNEKELNFQVYPNPASEQLTFSYELKQAAKTLNFQVSDITGKTVIKFSENNLIIGKHEQTFNVADLPKGTYLLTMEMNGKKYTKQVLIAGND